ncbi:ABC transporter ATP-binding protein [Rhizobium rhizoryzae]|uniref:ABC-type cobalamin/Fe3+-siderophores transport system ATPase subunit n=1 Tax=Rhizobium rhizoryzae TaxID=451876 RepID=A0A7W6PSI3_9HYPH|nr:ABC transporter ATP-binding protein [Rhizobium rhizoryzae]MBB4145603.1 ABC-type cobalamin/Fe3+-siderophores transport system ATPase subunit [Rhizobium rhizoryzae]
MTGRLVLRDVSVVAGKKHILSDVTVSLPAGQIVALIGPNGAGKSTLLGAISGVVSSTGSVLWNAQVVSVHDLGYMPQHCQVTADLTVLEVIPLGRHEQLGWRVDPSIVEASARILSQFGIADLAERKVSTLSGGQQQLALLAQRLLRKPPLLLLDEATSALDMRHQIHVLKVVKDYVARTQALVLIAIHDLNFAARHCDSVMLLADGKIERPRLFRRYRDAGRPANLLRYRGGVSQNPIGGDCHRPHGFSPHNRTSLSGGGNDMKHLKAKLLAIAIATIATVSPALAQIMETTLRCRWRRNPQIPRWLSLRR